MLLPLLVAASFAEPPAAGAPPAAAAAAGATPAPGEPPSAAEPPEGARDTALIAVEEGTGAPSSPTYSVTLRSQEGVVTEATLADDGKDGDDAAGDHTASRRLALSGGLYEVTLTVPESPTPLYTGSFAFTADDLHPRLVLTRSATGVTSSAAPVASPLPAGPAVDLATPEEPAVTTWGRAVGTGVGAFVVGFGLVAAWGLVDRRRRPRPLGDAAPPTPLGLPLSPGTTAWIAPAEETDALLEALAAALAPWGSTLLVPRPGSPLAAALAGRTGHVFRLPQERPTAAAVARAARDLGPRTALLVDGPEAVEAPLADEPRTAVLAELVAAKPAWLQLVLREGEEPPAGVTQTVRVARVDGALRPLPPAGSD